MHHSPPDQWAPLFTDDDLWGLRTKARGWVLVLLHDQPSHGYELVARLSGLGCSIPPSRIYRALRWLEKRQLVDQVWDMAGLGPARRVYTTKPEATWSLEVFANRIRSAARDLDPRMAHYVRRVLDDLAGGTRTYTISLSAQLVVSASTEGIALRKLDRFFSPRTLEADIKTTGVVRVDGVVEAGRRSGGRRPAGAVIPAPAAPAP